MKKIITTVITAIISLTAIAQSESLTHSVLTSSSFQSYIDTMGVYESEFYPKEDDSYLIGTFPYAFGENGSYYFQLFSSKSGRATFSSNTRGEIKDFPDYYEKNIKGFESDSIKTRVSTENIWGDANVLRETYTFYKEGKVSRIIRISFLGGKELWNFRDVTILPKKDITMGAN